MDVKRSWIWECLYAVKQCHETAGTDDFGATVPRNPTREWLLSMDGLYPSTTDTCVKGGLLREVEDGGLELTAAGLAFLDGVEGA